MVVRVGKQEVKLKGMETDLTHAGDRLQSSASRMAEWIREQVGVERVGRRPPYEVHLAAIEAQSAVDDWTAARTATSSSEPAPEPQASVQADVAPVAGSSPSSHDAALALYHAANCLIGQADADSTVATVLTPAVVAFENAALSSHDSIRSSDG